jgi:hypothetical protein
MKNRSIRIKQLQQRAKRRAIFIALGATAFAGYSAMTLFAIDPGTSSVEQLAKVPAVRSVGIRLIKPAETRPVELPPNAVLPSTSDHGLMVATPALIHAAASTKAVTLPAMQPALDLPSGSQSAIVLPPKMNGGLPSLPTLMLPPPSSTMNSLQRFHKAT